MALFRKTEGLRQKLLNKSGANGALTRLSDLQGIVFGGRGGSYDTLQYVRHQNTDTTANQKLSDGWVKFGAANGAAGSRFDQINHDFTINGTFP